MATLAAARSKVLAEVGIYVQMSVSVVRERLGLEELIVRIHGGGGGGGVIKSLAKSTTERQLLGLQIIISSAQCKEREIEMLRAFASCVYILLFAGHRVPGISNEARLIRAGPSSLRHSHTAISWGSWA